MHMKHMVIYNSCKRITKDYPQDPEKFDTLQNWPSKLNDSTEYTLLLVQSVNTYDTLLW